MIIDCFTFFNELKMLHFRLEETFEHIDYYVLVESTKTFSGIDKELYYQNNKHLFKKYQSKIIHVIVDDVDMPNEIDNNGEIIGEHLNDINWTRERFQRNAIMRGLIKLNLSPNDIILINDVDEIINTQTIDHFKHVGVSGMYVLILDAYLYNFNNKIIETHPPLRINCGSRAVDYETLLHMGTVDTVRNTYLFPKYKEFYPNGSKNDHLWAWLVQNTGWHLSYFGDENDIINKIRGYSHQELNKEEIINNIGDYINNSKCISGEYQTHQVDIESNDRLPKNYKILT